MTFSPENPGGVALWCVLIIQHESAEEVEPGKRTFLYPTAAHRHEAVGGGRAAADLVL